MTYQKLKVGFIFVLYKTPQSEINRLKKEVKNCHSRGGGNPDYRIYFIDNSDNGQGYASGVNAGLKKAIKDGCELFAIANPDIKLVKIDILDTFDQFDVWGFAMHQQGKTYYGGHIDKWRMSGGLSQEKPISRFITADFVSGSLMFIKKSVIDKIGFFDESYFMYYEEVDYCYRAKKSGFRVGIDSKQYYDHFEISQDNPSKQFYLFKNRLKFLLKYGTLKQKIFELLRIPKTVFEEINKRPFYLNFFTLNVSSVVNKILHFGLFLVLINYFKPDEYAIYTLTWTQIGLLLPLLDFGTTSYGLVHINDSIEKKIRELFSLRFYLSVITFVLTIILAITFQYPLSILIPIILTSFVIFANMFSGTYLILSSIKQKSYLASLVSMIFQICLVISLIVGVLISKQLITVFIITFILYNIYSLINFFLVRKEVGSLSLKIDLKQWSVIIKKSFIFLLISLLAGFYSKVDVLILNFIKGKQAVGIYSAGYRFLDALMFVVTAYNISSMPLFSKLAKEKKKNIFLNKIKKDVILVFAIGMFVALGFYFLGPVILPIVYKSTYFQSIQVLRIIIFALPLILLTSVFLNSIYALNKAKTVIYIFLFQLILNVALNLFFIPRYGFFASAYITLLGEAINTLLTFAVLRYVLYTGSDPPGGSDPNPMKISVDGGALNPKNNKRFGTAVFSENLVKALQLYDKENQYSIYTFKNLKPKLFWLKGRVSFEELKQKKDVFLALNQAVPLYTSGKIISFCHGLSYHFYPELYSNKDVIRLNKQLKEMIKRSDKIIVSSQKVKAELVSINRLIDTKIFVLTFGMPLDMKRGRIKKKEKYFLFVANNQPIKNIDFILQSFKRLKCDIGYKGHKLILVGNWKKYENKNLGIVSIGNVSRSKLKSLYQNTSALLTSSFYESFNFPVLEALSQGCPVIGLKSAIIPELAPYVNSVNNLDKFVENMKKITKKPSVSSINRLYTKFNWKNYVSNLVRLY
jgi:O-antigen/teichoic acid export membrane protein